MPKRNFGKGGKKHKKGKRNRNNQVVDIDPENGIMYALVDKKPGGHFLDVICTDGVKRKCSISGRFWKRVFCQKGDIVTVSVRNEMSSENICDLYGKPDQSNAKRELTMEDRKALYGDEQVSMYDDEIQTKSNELWNDSEIRQEKMDTEEKPIDETNFVSNLDKLDEDEEIDFDAI